MRILCKALLHLFSQATVCGFCGRACACEVAHVFARQAGGGGQMDIPANLIPLGHAFACACHFKSHNNQPPSQEQLIVKIAERWRRSAVDILAELNRARWQLRKGDVYECPFTGFRYWQEGKTDAYYCPWETLDALLRAGVAPIRHAPPRLAPQQDGSGWQSF